MSVPAYNRKENKLDILNIAMQIFEDSVAMIKQNDLLSKKNYRILGEPFLSNVRQMMYSVSIANNIHVKSGAYLKRRLLLQNDAKNYAICLQVDIQLMIKLTPDQKTILKCGDLLKKIDEFKAKTAKWIKYTADDYVKKHKQKLDLEQLI